MRRASKRPQVPFVYKLVLNQWLLSLFNVKRFEDLAEHLCNEALEGLDENNGSMTQPERDRKKIGFHLKERHSPYMARVKKRHPN